MQHESKIPHLQCVGGRYQFRRRIPNDVREAFGGKTERVITLKATDPEDLKNLVQQHAKAFDREVAAARKALESEPRDEDVPVLGERYYASMLASDESLRDELLRVNAGEADYRAEREMLEALLIERRRAAGRGDFMSVRDLVDAVLHAERMREPADPVLLRRLGQALLYADVRALEAQLARHRGDYVATPEFPARLRGRYVGEAVLGAAGYVECRLRLTHVFSGR